jgi:glycine cleavage system aminomethyltransferase T
VAEINEHPEILLYTRIRKSPYFYASRRHGVQMYSVYNHTYHPRHYGDPVEEYWQLLNGVTLWDVGVERQIEISGPDAFEFTNLLVARDLNKCEVEQCKYVFLCLPDGGIINDPVLMRVRIATWSCGPGASPTNPTTTSRFRRSTSGRSKSRDRSRRRSWSTCSVTASWRSPTTSCARMSWRV